MNIDFENIKCIIWDMDDTLWKGTLMSGDTLDIKKSKRLLEFTTKTGVINCICSKNDRKVAEDKLEEFGLSDFFVFNTINYEPKGQRIANQIKNMQLLPENVLFLDDEIANLKEAEFYNKGIMISQPFVIQELTEFYEKLYNTGYRKDRLSSYRLLEKKTIEKKIFSSNVEFLKNSEIIISIHSDCQKQIDRLYELCTRTHQLNFTKQNISRKQFEQEIIEADKCAYIEVSDKYGYYGVVGFYLIKNDVLKHFFFSCRILNMGIEQYMYQKLGCPEIRIVEPVATVLYSDNKVSWIKENDIVYSAEGSNKRIMPVILKGACDFKRMQLFLDNKIEFEVQYVKNGRQYHYQNGFPAMAMSLKYNIDQIRNFAEKTPCFSEEYYCSKIFENEYDMVFLSTISLANMGVYKHKKEDFFLGMGIPEKPMFSNETDYYSDGKYDIGFNSQKDEFRYLRDNFDYVYDRYLDDFFPEHLALIISKIKSQNIYLVLGNEERYSCYKSESGRFYAKANKIISDTAKKLGCGIINISDYVKSQDDIINHFNHFSSKVYFEIAQRINDLIKELSIV